MTDSALPGHRATIGIEVVYAHSDGAIIKSYQLAAPAQVGDVLKLAAVDPAFAGIEVERSPVGVFGRLAQSHDLLVAGDRIEIYRDLAADPKTARRARVHQARRKVRSA